jgi:hypothetical protein
MCVISFNRLMLAVKTNMPNAIYADGIKPVFEAIDDASFVGSQSRNIDGDAEISSFV